MLLITFMFVTPSAPETTSQKADSGMLYTKDNINIAYEHYKNGSDSLVIICPGFYNSKDNRWMRKTMDTISPVYDIIIFDFRGHGRSGGEFTWSAEEHMDVDAVVDYAAACGYKHIGIIAFSLGAAAAVNSAAARNDIDSMILISCPSSFKAIDYHFWEREMLADLMDNIECKWQGKGARVSSIFLAKEDPINSISLIEKTAILFINGDKDWVIKAHHSQELYDAARVRKKLEIMKGGLHAERLIQFHAGMMKELMLDWFSKTLLTRPIR